MGSSQDITRILSEWDKDPLAALDQLTPLVYDELRHLAGSILSRDRPGNTLQPTALVHEAYLRLAGQTSIAWKDRGHFFAVAARAMRLILVDSARRHFSQKRGGGRKVELHDEIAYSPENAEDFLDLNDAIEALRVWDDRKCSVIEMKYFGGLDREQIAEALGMSVGTAKRDVALGEAFLRRQMCGSA